MCTLHVCLHEHLCVTVVMISAYVHTHSLTVHLHVHVLYMYTQLMCGGTVGGTWERKGVGYNGSPGGVLGSHMGCRVRAVVVPCTAPSSVPRDVHVLCLLGASSPPSLALSSIAHPPIL